MNYAEKNYLRIIFDFLGNTTDCLTDYQIAYLVSLFRYNSDPLYTNYIQRRITLEDMDITEQCFLDDDLELFYDYIMDSNRFNVSKKDIEDEYSSFEG